MLTEDKRQQIKNTPSYRLVRFIAQWMDRYLLDPLIGLVLPSIGDALTSVCMLPFLYLSLFQLRSIPLTLAILCNMLLDILIGIIPYVGVVGDVFKRAFSRNAVLIEGYVEGDIEVIKSINRKAVWMALWIVVLCALIYGMVLAAVSIVEWIGSLF